MMLLLIKNKESRGVGHTQVQQIICHPAYNLIISEATKLFKIAQDTRSWAYITKSNAFDNDTYQKHKDITTGSPLAFYSNLINCEL